MFAKGLSRCVGIRNLIVAKWQHRLYRKGDIRRMEHCVPILVPQVSKEIIIMNPEKLTYEQKEMINWMDSLCPWETFFTGTTTWKSSAECLKRCYEGFMKKHYPAISYAYCLEPFKTRGWVTNGMFNPAFHMHAMFDAGHDISWKEFWATWFKKYGRCKTEPIRHKADVQSYVTKYLMKSQDDKTNIGRNEIWWDVKLSKYRKHMRKQAQEGCLMA